MVGRGLSYGTFQRDGEELLGLDGKLHGELLQHFLGIAVDNEAYGLLGGYAALVAVEELVLGDLRGGGLVLEDGGRVLHVHIREGVGATAAAQQEGVAGRVVAGVLGGGCCAHQSAVGVLRVACRDALGDDGRLGVASQVYHLRARVGLLVVVGDGDGVELGL